MNNYLLQILNGSAVLPELIWITLLSIYLSKESKRRGLHWFNWFALPASMNLMLAIFIYDFAILIRTIVIWAWRRFDLAAQFGPSQQIVLIAAGSLVLIGALCKIRAWTHPDYGNGPWLAATAITILVTLGLMIF